MRKTEQDTTERRELERRARVERITRLVKVTVVTAAELMRRHRLPDTIEQIERGEKPELVKHTPYKSHPLRVQRKRTCGFRLLLGAVVVTRPTKWGNPFRVETFTTTTAQESRALCVEAFEDWLTKGDSSRWWLAEHRQAWQFMRVNLESLRGKQLACFCSHTQPCHADVLARHANSQTAKRQQELFTVEGA